MIEIRYRNDNHRITAWCKDSLQFGNLAQREGETIAIWDAQIPAVRSDHYIADPETQTIEANPSYQPIAPQTVYWAEVIAFDPQRVRPLQVRRTWEGYVYEAWVYVTENLVDLYQSGELEAGDYVIVLFVDDELDQRLATQKVYRSW